MPLILRFLVFHNVTMELELIACFVAIGTRRLAVFHWTAIVERLSAPLLAVLLPVVGKELHAKGLTR